jgi:hypothetical protein
MDGTAQRVPALRLLHAVPNWLPGRRCPGTLSNHLAPASSSSQMYCPRRHDEQSKARPSQKVHECGVECSRIRERYGNREQGATGLALEQSLASPTDNST